jgi:hypothetical protein
MRCARYRDLYRRFPRLRTYLIRKHFIGCDVCRREMESETNGVQFFRAEDLDGEDLWPALRERLSSLGEPEAGPTAVTRRSRPHPRAKRFGPAFAPALILALAVLAAVSYLGIRSLRGVLNSERRSGLRPAESEALAAASPPGAVIEQAFISGKRARVFIYVEPKNPLLSFFWLEPSKE